jgi:acetyl-CoA synthetase
VPVEGVVDHVDPPALKVGAAAQPIFSGFSPLAAAERLRDSGAKVLVTADGYYRRGRVVELKPLADRAVEAAPNVEKVVVVERLGLEVGMKEGRDVYYRDLVSGKRGAPKTAEMDPEDPALLLYTSGTTGKPKGAVISHAGALLQPAKEHFFNLDMKPGDVLFWVTDIGWMMGPWQIIGSQHLGLTHLIMEGAPDYPEPDRIWSLVEKYRVTQLGFSSTLVRMLRRYGNEYVERHDLSSLRALGNTGEPLDEKSWWWLLERVGERRVPIINLSGGTELFGCLVLPSCL